MLFRRSEQVMGNIADDKRGREDNLSESFIAVYLPRVRFL